MFSAINKISLYEFFSVFLSGIMIALTGDLLLFKGQYSQGLEIVRFLISGFFIGCVLHIVSSKIDKKLPFFNLDTSKS